jgi:hypothetical protein
MTTAAITPGPLWTRRTPNKLAPPVVDEPYGNEGIAPALLATEDPLVAFVAWGEQTGPTAPGPSSSLLGGFTYRAAWASCPVFSCCATTGADDLHIPKGRTVLLA